MIIITNLTAVVKNNTLRFLTKTMDITSSLGVALSEERHLTPLSIRLKEAKQLRGLTADRIAELLDCSPSTVRHWWTARSEPSFDTLERYAELCGVSAYWLITGKPDQQDVVARLYKAMGEFRTAVTAGEQPLAAWERILGHTDILTDEERQRLSTDPAGMRAYLTSLDGVEWVALTPEQHRLVQELVQMLGRYAAEEKL
jgi:transcriptional regulator with XRE-family HTH domain